MSPRHYALCACWIGGIALTGLLGAFWPLLPLLCLIACLRGQRHWRLILACSLLMLAGLGWSHLRQLRPGAQNPSHLAPLAHVRLAGEVRSDLVDQGQGRWTLDLQGTEILNEMQRRPVKGLIRVHLKTNDKPIIRIGDRVEIDGRLALPAQALNFGAFSYRAYLRQQGIFSVVYAHALHKRSDGPAWQPRRLLQQLRLLVLAGFEARLPLEQARLLGSLLLGAGASPVPEAVADKFQAAGLQHVLAVSGFQVQLVVLGALALCHLLRLRRGVNFALSLTLLWLFVALTGFPASVLRAGVVASLGLLGYLRFRQLDPLAGLTLGACLLLLIEPWLLADIGFQFSMLATLGLIVTAPWLQERLKWLPLPVSGACAPILAAQIWVLPAQLLHFGTLSWLFLPANLLAGLLTTALSWLAIGAALFAWLPPLQALILLPAGWMAQAFLASLDLLLRLPSPVLNLPTLAVSLTILAYGVLLLKLRPRARFALTACLVSLPLLSAGMWLGERQSCPVRITFISVGQGDATLLEAGDQTVLIDAGPRWQSAKGFDDAGKRDILPYLQRRGIRRLSAAFVSHGHLDHYGGFVSLIDKIEIARFITVPGPGDSEAYLQLLTAIQKKNIPFEIAQNGSVLVLAQDLRLVLWQPLPDDEASLNDQSLVMQLRHGDFSLLLSGDLEAEGEAALLRTPGFDPRHTVLKVPHHGSRTSSTPAFLTAVQPAEAVISVGERNRYRHPSPEVIDRYQELGIRTWRTDQNGAVCICSRGGAYDIRTAIRE